MVDALRSQAHEFSNTIHTISGLIELGRSDDVLEMISEHSATHQRLTSAYQEQISDPFLVGLLMAKSAMATERGIGFSIKSEGLVDVRLVGTRELITILGNLVDNALDSVAGPRNTGGAVHVELRRQGAALAMSVSDNGPGIPPNVRRSMFKEGFTTKNTDTHSGIGLALVNSSVNERDGTIRVEHNNGTTFHVVIPIVFDLTEVGAS